MAGAVAQYGRAAWLLKEIANQIVGQFARNLREEIVGAGGAGPVGADATAASAPSAVAPSAAAPGTAPAPVGAQPKTAASPSAPARELSAFPLLWAALKAWVGGLFRRGKS